MYWLLRCLSALPTLIGVSLFAFLVIHFAPGDPLSSLLQGEASDAVAARLREHYGLDQPFVAQYFRWLSNMAVGDFGSSIALGQPVGPILFDAIGNTLKILLPAAVLAVGGGWWLGNRAGRARTPAGRHLLSILLPSLVSIPPYWLGMVLVAALAVAVGWLPAMGMGPARELGGVFSVDGALHLVLPTVTLAAGTIGILARSTKAAVESAAQLDFVEAMRARGASEKKINRRIAMNVAPGLASLYGLQVAYLFGAAILVESVFAWPGLGSFLINAIQHRDFPSIQAALLVLGVAFVLLNLLADIVQGTLDPRVRR